MKETRPFAKERLQSILSSRKRTIVPNVSNNDYHDDRIEKIEKAIIKDISEIMNIPEEKIKINYEENSGYLLLVVSVITEQ
ncbi:MAG: hypothetical protein PWQ20_1482 [Thermotogaceae bacterium]|jgi:cell division topological specificity factor|nr:hypothetical protein [Thermotogaceae bacterium]MDN5338412.1 hypothetical protein [Thermotogaceae bacterium]